MALTALVLSLFVAAVGALGVVSPAKLLGLVRRFQCPAGLYSAAVFRVLLGTALFVTAAASRAPGAVRVAGAIIFVSGLVTPLFGVERLTRMLDWWSAQNPVFLRVWASFALAIGLLLSLAVSP